jgi:hypothetical protein
MYGSPSIGIEVQVTFWGYKDPSPFGDAIFKKYRIINRSGHEIKDMYIGQWADVDDGSAGDDVVGCDSSLQLGFTYNFTNKDAVYGAFTPAVGFACLLGPAVDGSPSDTAVINDNYVAGKKNLPMSSFIFFAGGDANLGDPPQETYNGTLQMYNFLRGTIGLTGEPFKVPTEFGGGVTKFPVSGDPVTGTGWLDGYGTSEGGLPSGDRRMATSCGPFNMAQNDTQTVVFAEIVAGDQNVYHHLAGVSLLKARTNFIRNYIPELKDIRKEISVLPASGTGLHREVVLNWGGSYDSLLSYENFNHSAFKFEGYKIYQLKSPA